MFIKHLLVGLKSQKFAIYEKNIVAETFPELLAQCLQMIKVINLYGEEQVLSYDWQKLVQFKVNMGNAVYTETYNSLDNILIDFLSTYHYKKVTPAGSLVMFSINFLEEEKNIFIEKCESFKGKKWDNIVNDLIDAIYNLFNSATIHGNKLR